MWKMSVLSLLGRGRGREGEEDGIGADLCETGRALSCLLTSEIAQAIVFCFGGGGLRVVVESYRMGSELDVEVKAWNRDDEPLPPSWVIG